MKNQKIFIAIIALAAMVSVLLAGCSLFKPQGTEGSKTFTVTVVHGDSSEKNISITSTRQYLAEALRDEKIIGDEGIKTGMYITVDGETADWDKDQAYWGIYINGEYAMYGLNDIAIEEGAVYKLEYTAGNYGG